jgi:hypothetical protein
MNSLHSGQIEGACPEDAPDWATALGGVFADFWAFFLCFIDTILWLWPMFVKPLSNAFCAESQKDFNEPVRGLRESTIILFPWVP